MLLSSVNFVAKPKTGKSKDKADKKLDKAIEEPQTDASKVCKKCLKEIEDENTIFRFPTSSSLGSGVSCTTSGYASEENLDVYHPPGERVNIATVDDLCLTVEQFYYTIGLRDKSRSDSTCIFRKKVLESRPLPNGHVETVVFALDCDQEFYLTASKNRDLELNYYAVDPSLECPDDRMFLIYFTDLGHCLIQPKLLKNMYFHHIDQALSIQPLDLNWRCPEEYFFHFSAVPEPFVRPKTDIKVCMHTYEKTENEVTEKNTETTVESSTQALVKTITAEVIKHRIRHEIPVQQLSSKPQKGRHEIPVQQLSRKPQKGRRLLSELLFGCFSAKSTELTTTEV